MKTALAGILVLAAAVRLIWFSGLQVGDDIVYSRIAVERLDGKWTVNNVQETRHAFLLPIVACYAIFGPGELPLVLYNLLCSLGTVALVFFLVRRGFGPWGGIWAAAMAAVHPNLVFHATECHTDTPLAFWTLASLMMLFRSESSARPMRDMAISGLLLGWAYLHKESAVFVLPFFLGRWLCGARSWRVYVPAAAALVALIAAEAVLNGAWTGDPLRRVTMIRTWHVGPYMVEAHPDARAVLARVFLELPRKLFFGYGAVNLFALAAAAALWFRKDAPMRRFAGWFLAIYASTCAWPSSLVPYLPAFNLYAWTLPPLVVPLLCILGGALGRLRPSLAAGAAVFVAATSMYGVIDLHASTRRLTAGPREAYAWIARHAPATVVSDDGSIQVFDFLEGHKPQRRYVPFQALHEATEGVAIVDRFWTEPDRWWSRPSAAVDPGWEKLLETPRITIYRFSR